jgi:hypothetical protein
MYVFPASQFKVHAANEPGLAGEQKPFPISFFALGGVCFLQLQGLADEHFCKHSIKILFPRFFTELAPRTLDMT